MNQRPSVIFRLSLLSLLALSGVLEVPLAAQDESAPLKPEDMQLPDAKELMTADPYDWVYTTAGQVFVTEPVYPRPDTLRKIAAERAELDAARGGNAQQRGERNARKAELKYVNIVLLDDQSEDYQIQVSQIEKIVLFEDLMLERAKELMERPKPEIAIAYDLILQVEQMVPGWDRVTPLLDRLLVVEAEQRSAEGNQYAALALLDELAVRKSESPELPAQMSKVVDVLIAEAVEARDYDKAKYFLNRLKKHFPDHPVGQRWESKLEDRMQALLDQAGKLNAAGRTDEAAKAATNADHVWRIGGSLRETYREYVSRFQTFRVPVRHFAGEKFVSPVESPADQRHRQLTEVQLFEPYDADELTYFQSSFFDLWDPQDLGREVVFSIRQSRPYWQSQPLLSANQIADTLSDQLNPDLASFNPRLASFVRGFSVPSPTELQVNFTRVPLNLEALFRFPVVGIPEGDESSLHDAPRELLSTRFHRVDQTDTTATYRRTIPEPEGLIRTKYHVAEIVEQKYPDRHAEIQAFVRGEVDMLPHLMPWEVDIFKASGDSFVQQYIMPQTHVLVFNPLSDAVTNPQIRRALSFGVDREGLLEKVILRDPEKKYGRPAKAPWHSGSYANSPLVEAPKYDMYLCYLLRMAALQKLRIPEKQKFVANAKAEALAAKKEWDELKFRRDNAEVLSTVGSEINLPTLRFVVAEGDVSQLAAEQMVLRWRTLGFEIELIPADKPGERLAHDGWDFMYRNVRLQEPLLDLWSLMLTDHKFDVTRLASYPDWMRQELINLDYATSFQDAQQRLFTIHRHMAAQAFIVPLWELDDFVAFQRNVTGFEGRPLSVYQGVERWQVKP